MEVAGNLLKKLKDKQSLGMLDTEVSFSVKKLFLPNRNFGGYNNSKQAAWCSQVLYIAHAVNTTKVYGLNVCSHSSFQEFLNERKHNSI